MAFLDGGTGRAADWVGVVVLELDAAQREPIHVGGLRPARPSAAVVVIDVVVACSAGFWGGETEFQMGMNIIGASRNPRGAGKRFFEPNTSWGPGL